jgi:hypothetical protein
MTGIQLVTDDKGRKVAVLIDLKKHGARLQDFWDGLISDSRSENLIRIISAQKASRDEREIYHRATLP